MSLLLAIVAIILSLILVVGLHEAGHAWAARFFNVKIIKISIGFGRPLLRWQGKNGCDWCWSMWPLGGYVKLLNSRIENVSASNQVFCFDKKPIWVRCLILLAGALSNLLIAWLAMVLVLVLGYPQMKPVIQSVSSSSLAFAAGLSAGDRFISIANHATPSWREVAVQLLVNLGENEVSIVVENKFGEIQDHTFQIKQLSLGRETKTLLDRLGVVPDVSSSYVYRVEGISIFVAGLQAFKQIAEWLFLFLIIIKQLIVGLIPFTFLMGPLGLFDLMISSFFEGLTIFLYFISNLSVGVALINLFPIPGLDGGAIAYALLEKIRGKPISVAMEILLHRLTLIVLGVFLVHVLMNDLHRYMTY